MVVCSLLCNSNTILDMDIMEGNERVMLFWFLVGVAGAILFGIIVAGIEQ
jgi:hypothetical protein